MTTPGAGHIGSLARITTSVEIDLAGIVLPDIRDGAPVDLGAGPPLAVLSAIRHRY